VITLPHLGKYAQHSPSAQYLYRLLQYYFSLFLHTIYEIRGGGFNMFFDNTFPVFINMDISGNVVSAGSGGGLYMHNMNTGPVLDHVSVAGNRAAQDGGGVYLSMANVAILFQSSSIAHNVAETGSGGGGSMTLGEKMYAVCADVCGVCWRVSVSGNSCHIPTNYIAQLISTGNGEGILSNGNAVIFRDTAIVDNAAGKGGGLYIGESNYVSIDSCLLSKNTALLEGGGGISVYQRSQVSITDTLLESNRAVSCGGGVESVVSNSIVMNGRYSALINDKFLFFVLL
jgi:hypothetical protein